MRNANGRSTSSASGCSIGNGMTDNRSPPLLGMDRVGLPDAIHSFDECLVSSAKLSEGGRSINNGVSTVGGNSRSYTYIYGAPGGSGGGGSVTSGSVGRGDASGSHHNIGLAGAGALGGSSGGGPGSGWSGGSSSSSSMQQSQQHLVIFEPPSRPSRGTEGRSITLRANHFEIRMPKGFLHHYDVTITPEKCPRRVNREIIETMVNSMHYQKYFYNQKPVFDGRRNMYTRDPLPISKEKVELEVMLPGEGKDRVFRVAIKHVSEVSLFALEEALEGRAKNIPQDAVLSLDVIMRHLPSMRWVPFRKMILSKLTVKSLADLLISLLLQLILMFKIILCSLILISPLIIQKIF
ncbi:unnamed protein product [Protopolystoma xenopodis]|uniref:Protein argonaute N-terminal domain-containing protein n=1 Tax=Protopolystoma xenopodis TaxID=117903 RepID=A0A448X3T6_9PLAT|nr:unnamed protein product [Protopolystoma xenopodis]